MAAADAEQRVKLRETERRRITGEVWKMFEKKQEEAQKNYKSKVDELTQKLRDQVAAAEGAGHQKECNNCTALNRELQQVREEAREARQEATKARQEAAERDAHPKECEKCTGLKSELDAAHEELRDARDHLDNVTAALQKADEGAKGCDEFLQSLEGLATSCETGKFYFNLLLKPMSCRRIYCI